MKSSEKYKKYGERKSTKFPNQGGKGVKGG
jgi:hypothetical protein